MKPIYIHSGMAGAPQYANANDSINAILTACLTPEGFNLKTATSASASAGILTLNFAANPGFEALQTVEVAVADVALVNGQHRVIANANNQVTIAIAGLPDGAVGSSGAGITIKQAGAGWSKPFSSSTVAVFRPPAGSRRYLRVVHVQGENAEMRGYEEMSDVNTGNGEFPTTVQAATPFWGYNTTFNAVSGALWWLAATDKWVRFCMTNGTTSSGYTVGALFFGNMAEQVKPTDLFTACLSTIQGVFAARNLNEAIGSTACTLQYTPSKNMEAGDESWLRFLPYVPVTETDGPKFRGVLPNTLNMLPRGGTINFGEVYNNVGGVSGRMVAVPAGWNLPAYTAICVDEEDWA